MIGITNSSGGGSGGTLTVTAPAGVTVTASKDGKTYTRTANAQGVAVFKGLKTGLWSVTISDGVQQPTTMQVNITADYAVTMAFFAAFIQVTYPAGSVCKCSKGSNVLTASGTSGSGTFTVPEAGDWVVSCTNGADSDSKTVTITTDRQTAAVNLAYQMYASDFNWAAYGKLSIDYQIVYDDDTEIPGDLWPTAKNWKARLLTSNTLIPTKDGKIDVFLVGGGSGAVYSGETSKGGGGAGGYTRTVKDVSVSANTAVVVTVGAGSAAGGKWNQKGDGPTDGGYSAFGDFQASGGFGQTALTSYTNGLTGGTGGQQYVRTTQTPAVDGADGAGTDVPGKGQRSTPGPNGETGTTGEFGDETATLYSGGCYTGQPRPNSGDAGRSSGSVNAKGTAGASGIVVIRNARGGAA